MDSSLSDQDYFKTSFRLAQSPSNPTYGLEVLEPFEDASYCLDSSDANIPLYYVLQTSNNEELEDPLIMKYVLTFEREAIKENDEFELQRGLHADKSSDSVTFTKAVESLNGEGAQNAKFTYDIYEKLESKKVKSKTIDFTIRVPEEGSTCEDISLFYDYKPLSGEDDQSAGKNDGQSQDGTGGSGDVSSNDPEEDEEGSKEETRNSDAMNDD